MKPFDSESEEIVLIETHTIKRLKLSNVFSNILQSLNLEKGWIFSLKSIFTDVGGMALDYAGKGRLKYKAPFKMLFVTTTLAFFIFKYSGSISVFTQGIVAGSEETKTLDLLEKASKYFNLLIWIYIPIAAYFTWLFNKKKSKINYAENLVYQTYFFVLTNMITLLIFFDRVLIESFIWSLLITLSVAFYNTYGYKNFFKKTWVRSFFESSALFLFNSILYFSLLIVAAAFYIKYQ